MLTSYVMYVIWFSNQSEYNAAVALAGGHGWQHCPFNAATTFGITWPITGGPITGTKGIYANSGSPNWDSEIYFPGASGIFMSTLVDSVIVPGQAGNPPDIWPAGQSCNFVWLGNIIYQVNDVGGVPPTTPIPPRRWIGGFETSGTALEGGISYTLGGSRISSRTIDGMGYTLRGANNPGSQRRSIATFRPGLTPKTSWERFYIRIDALGTNELIIWYAEGQSPGGEGAAIRIDTSGYLLVYNAYSVSAGPLMGTSSAPLTLNQWFLIDVLLTWPTIAADVGRVRVYINHILDINATVNTGFGIDRLTYHLQSTLGQQSATEAQWEVNLDDWICADVPNNGGVESLDSIDWLVGSHVKLIYINSGSLINWVGHVLMSNQSINANQPSTSSALTSSTALATIQGLADTSDEQITPGVVLGPVAAWIGAYVSASLSSAGRIGYKIAGGATVWNNVTDPTGFNWVGYLYSQSGLELPTTITSFSILKEHSNDTHAYTINALCAIVESIGAWGIEDNSLYPLDISNNINFLLHNCRYANTIYALGPDAGAPVAPCYAVGGTYVGNGTSTTINLSAPAHFIWIRGIAGPASSTSGCKWFGGGLGGHEGIKTQVYSNFITRCWVDATGQAKFTVTGDGGASGEVNSNGKTYQYIAFCDPGMRFNYCGAFNVNNALASAIISLFDSGFIAGAGFIQEEILQSVGNVDTLSYKGPGHTGNIGSLLTGVDVTNWGSFAAGALTVLGDIITSTRNGSNFSLWRTTDFCNYAAIQFTSYVGDGTASKTINLPNTTGRYPLFAMVLPHNSVPAYMRDPSHTGANSCVVGTLVNSITAITGASAPDQINVGITLNTAGITYDVFVILGDSIGWNNGIFYPPYCLSSGDWEPPPYDPGEPIITMNGGINFNGIIPLLVIQNMSGIYTLVLGKTNDTIYTGFTDDTVDVKKPDPTFKLGYIGG